MASTCWVLGCSRHSAEAYCTNDHLNMYCTCSGDILGHYEPLRSPMLLGSAGYTTVMMFQTFQTFQDPLLRRADVWCLMSELNVFSVRCMLHLQEYPWQTTEVFRVLSTRHWLRVRIKCMKLKGWTGSVVYASLCHTQHIWQYLMYIYVCIYIYNIHIYRI